MELLKRWINSIKLWYYKQLANYYHESTGHRYYVIRKDDNRYQIVSSLDIAEHNRRNSKANKIDINTLLKSACYYTKSKI